MSQRIHDPTETGLPEYSTTGTLREILEKLKDGPDFHITVEIGCETDTPAEKDVLIRAMEAAGYTLDTIESTDDHLRFFGEGGQTMIMAGWHECEAWLNGVVFDDPAMSDRVEMILHPERFVSQAAATNTTMRAIEDTVEQNDNQFDGIINNLPDEPPAGTPDLAKAAREAADTAARSSILKKLREEERARPPRPPRPFMPDREERSLE